MAEVERLVQYCVKPSSRLIPLRMVGKLRPKEILQPFPLVGCPYKVQHASGSCVYLRLCLLLQHISKLRSRGVRIGGRLAGFSRFFLGSRRDVDAGKAERRLCLKSY